MKGDSWGNSCDELLVFNIFFMELKNFLHWNVVLIRFWNEAWTAFFYSKSTESESDKKWWVKIDWNYLVTAKHCLVNDTNGIVSNLTINYLLENEDWEYKKFEITIGEYLLKESLKLSKNVDVDIVLIDLWKINIEWLWWDWTLRMINKKSYMSSQNYSFNKYILPDTWSDIVVTWYPYWYYDDYNYFPVSKSWIVSSWWWLNFNDEPYFLVDVQLFPISSWSPVYTKPTNIVVNSWKILTNIDKQFVLLWVYIWEWHKKVEKICKIKWKDEIIEMSESIWFWKVCYSEYIDEIIDEWLSYEDYIKM